MGIHNSISKSAIEHTSNANSDYGKQLSKLKYLEPKCLSDDDTEYQFNYMDLSSNITHESYQQKQQVSSSQEQSSTNLRYLSVDEQQICVEEMNSIQEKMQLNKSMEIWKQGYVNYYNRHKLISAGIYTQVLEVINQSSGRHYAAKQINKTRIPVHKLYRHFLEVQILRQFDHPYIVKLFEVFAHQSKYFLIFQFIKGMNLEEYRQINNIEEQELITIARQLLKSVSCLHSNNVIHRDIRCEKIMKIQDKLMFKLIGFGKVTRCSGSHYLQSSVGTLPYMAPEVISQRYGQKCDIWSVGVVLYRLVTGKFPFYGKNKKQILANINQKNINFGHQKWGKYSPECISFIKKMLEKNPEYRPTAKQCLSSRWLRKKTLSCSIAQKNAFYQKLIKAQFLRPYQTVIKTYIVSQLMKDNDIDEIVSAFYRFDGNRDGLITISEIQAIFTELLCDETIIPKIMKVVRLENIGQIDYTGFLVCRLRKSKENDTIHEFDYFDIDQNGQISIDQLVNFLENKIGFGDQFRKLNNFLQTKQSTLLNRQELLDILLAIIPTEKPRVSSNKKIKGNQSQKYMKQHSCTFTSQTKLLERQLSETRSKSKNRKNVKFII